MANTVENFIKRHGIDGVSKYEAYINNIKENSKYYSDISQSVFNKIDKMISEQNFTTYYATKNNGEFGKYCPSNKKYYFIDYYIKELNLGIEFNGNYWHCNPKYYKVSDKPIYCNDLTAGEIWDIDNEKIKYLKKDHDIDIIVIWEDEVNYSEILNIIKNKN